MARYRKIETALWGDRRFRELSSPQPNGKSLWLYLLCGPRTTQLPGLIIARPAVMADDLGWKLEGFLKAFEEAFAKGMAKADWEAGVVLLPKALIDSTGTPRDTSRPESPNVLKSWAKAWAEVPDCALKVEYLLSLKSFAEALGEGFAKAFQQAFAKALAHPSPNQYQEQEQKQYQEQEEKNSATPSAGGSRSRKKPKPTEPTEAELASVRVVLSKLSAQNGVTYSGTHEHTRLIVNQLRNGVGEMDLRAVIGFCADELGWKNKPEMVHCLRPETLFGPKTIARYLDPARTWFEKLRSARAAAQQQRRVDERQPEGAVA